MLAVDDAAAALQRMAGQSDSRNRHQWWVQWALVSGLAVRGKADRGGCAGDPIQLNAFPLVFGGRSIYGA